MRLTATSWLAAPSAPHLQPGDVHVWRARLIAGEDAIATARAGLPAEDLARADRYLHPARGRLHVLSQSFLRQVLGAYLQTDPARLAFRHGAHGKPHLADATIFFNLSHSGDAALLAVTTVTPMIGVDIEQHGARSIHEIAERFFSPDERNAVVGADDPAEAFFAIWTRKEAFIKALGLGLACPLRDFDVSAAPGRAALTGSRIENQPVDAWSMADLVAFDGYSSALALRAPPATLTGFTWIFPAA